MRRETQVVKMDVFYSMWRSRTVECPWGTGRPACETVLLHHEQFKILENLARFAVRHGMWGFVKNLSEQTPVFIASRRAKGVAPDAEDPTAFGFGGFANPPASPAGPGSRTPGSLARGLPPSASSMSLCSMDSTTLGGPAGGSALAGLSRQGSAGLPRGKTVPGPVRKLLAVAVAGGLAALLHRSNSMPTLANAKALKTKRGHKRQVVEAPLSPTLSPPEGRRRNSVSMPGW
jgi:hypothetical protein